MKEEKLDQILVKLNQIQMENNRYWEENNKRWEENEKRLQRIEIRIGEVEEKVRQVDKRLENVEKRLDLQSKQIITIETKIQKSNQEMVALWINFQDLIEKRFLELEKRVETLEKIIKGKASKSDARFRDNEIEHDSMELQIRKLAYKLNEN